jgi:hypothetical protein
MSAYIVVELTLKDPEALGRYRTDVAPTLSGSGANPWRVRPGRYCTARLPTILARSSASPIGRRRWLGITRQNIRHWASSATKPSIADFASLASL